VITVSQNAANAEGSAVGIVAGGRYTVDDLFDGLLLMSGTTRRPRSPRRPAASGTPLRS